MSTPSPAGGISLPDAKPYEVTIHNKKHFPWGFPALLVFSKDARTKSWTASFSVPSVILTEPKCPVTQIEENFCQFEFTLLKPTPDQLRAGYIKGTYIFKFVAPGNDPIEFSGSLDDPWPDEAEDHWTAEGRPPDSGQGGSFS